MPFCHDEQVTQQAPHTASWPPPTPQQTWQPPLPGPPKPERPLKPALWWALGLNAVWALLWTVAMMLLAAFAVYVFQAVAGGMTDLPGDPRQSGMFLGLMAGAFLGSVLVGLVLTVGALLLLRLGHTFRTFPSFVQALLAGLCALAASSVLGSAVGFVTDMASRTPGMFGQ